MLWAGVAALLGPSRPRACPLGGWGGGEGSRAAVGGIYC